MLAISIITLIGILATAAATIALAVITKRYVRLTHKILQTTNRPNIDLYLRQLGGDGLFQGDIYLCIQNRGVGFAEDVTFAVEPSLQIDDTHLQDIEPYKSGIAYLGNGQKILTKLFDTGLEAIAARYKDPILITVYYKDSTGTPYEHSMHLDFSKWDHPKHFFAPVSDAEEIVCELQGIKKVLTQSHILR